MDEKLTIRERSFVQQYIQNGGNGTQAAMASYNCSSASSADAVSRETLERPRIQKALYQIMQEKGLDDDSLLTIHRELLNDSNPSVRMRALEVAYKISGRFDSRIILEQQKSVPLHYTPPVIVTREEMIEAVRIAEEGKKDDEEFKRKFIEGDKI